MSRFRKRPVVIEAVQFLRCATDAETHFNGPVPKWLDDAMADGRVRPSRVAGGPRLMGRLFIETPEGEMAADSGDWIIQGTKGEIYPCKPDIFADIYEPAEAFE